MGGFRRFSRARGGRGEIYPCSRRLPGGTALSTVAPPVVRTPAAGALLTPDDRADDGDLAGRIAAGDARAFERLYDRHRAEISRYCATLVRNPQDAEEAFQLTMLAAYRALSAGRGPRGALRPWLFRIAHNECVNLLRNRPPVEELTDRHPVAGLLQERVEARETLRQLSDDIAALPLRQRAAFVLHRIEGLPHAAVGEALGTTPLGARQLLHEARTTLDEFHAGRALACDDVRVRIGARRPAHPPRPRHLRAPARLRLVSRRPRRPPGAPPPPRAARRGRRRPGRRDGRDRRPGVRRAVRRRRARVRPGPPRRHPGAPHAARPRRRPRAPRARRPARRGAGRRRAAARPRPRPPPTRPRHPPRRARGRRSRPPRRSSRFPPLRPAPRRSPRPPPRPPPPTAPPW